MSLRTLRVFISSPGDVTEERVIARRVIGRLDAQFGDQIRLEAVYWEHAPLVATASFQEQLVRPSETDIAIVVLWSRLGTVLPSHLRRADGSSYASGTEFEFEDAVAGFERTGRPRLVAYRKTAPTPAPADLEALEEALRQKRAMVGFVARWFLNVADGSLRAAFHNFATAADFEDLLEAHLAKLVEAELPTGTRLTGAVATWRGRSPFRGLQAFEPEHAAVFFGRTAAVATVLAKLRSQAAARRAFVLLVGMSGGGKSSLVRAGVLPLMQQPGVLGTATSWRQAVVRPSDGSGDPVQALSRASTIATAVDSPTHDDVDEPTSIDGLVDRVVARLDAIARIDGTGGTCDLVLVVDQLEEVFSDERIAPVERLRFFEAIDALARSGRAWVIATMRSDAYPRIAEQPLLAALKEGDGQVDLLPPNLREIGQIIRFPAAAAGLRFEVRASTAERLDDVIRDAAARNPGALPLLQFLLEELYKRRNAEDVLTFRAYEELGGVEGALAQRAEAVLESVGPGARRALPGVLRELVTFGADDETQALRRVAPRSAFESSDAIALVDALIEARLLVGTLDADGVSAISLAHEALLEFWPRLRAWRDDDRELLLVHARLANATRAWEKNDRSADLLLPRGKPLAEARSLAAAGVRLNAAESDLLRASTRRAARFARLRAGAIGALGVLALVAAFAAWRATTESTRAQVQATTAQRTTDFMVSLFTVADPDANQGEKVTVRELLDKGVVEIRGQLAEEQGVRANMLRAMGQAYNGLGLYARAHELLRNALGDTVRDGSPADLLKVRMALAFNRYQDGDYDQAGTLYRLALDQAVALYGERSTPVAQATNGIAEVLDEKNQPKEAEALFRKALALNVALHGERSVDAARSKNGLGKLMFFAQRYDEAEALFRDLLETQIALFGPRNGGVALTLNNLGSLYGQTGRYDQATEAFARALPLYREIYGPDHKFVAGVLNNLGRVELLSAKTDAAEGHLAEAIAIDRKILAPGHDDLILPLNSLGMVMLAKGDPTAARPLFDEALSIARARQHWMLNQVLGNEADLSIRQGDLPGARTALDEARALLGKQFGDRLGTTEAWRSAVLDLVDASLQIARGDPASAERLLTAARPVVEQHFGKQSLYATRVSASLAALAPPAAGGAGGPGPVSPHRD